MVLHQGVMGRLHQDVTHHPQGEMTLHLYLRVEMTLRLHEETTLHLHQGGMTLQEMCVVEDEVVADSVEEVHPVEHHVEHHVEEAPLEDEDVDVEQREGVADQEASAPSDEELHLRAIKQRRSLAWWAAWRRTPM